MIGFIEPWDDGKTLAAFEATKNHVAGIGEIIFDVSSRYTSSGRLRGVVHIYPARRASRSYNFNVLNHEILHAWAVKLGFGLKVELGFVHWNAHLERPSSGFSVGWKTDVFLEKHDDAAYRAWFSMNGRKFTSHYNDLELYLMGLQSWSEVASPIRALTPNTTQIDTVLVDDDGNGYEIIRDGTLLEITIDEVVARMGDRKPQPRSGSTSFHTAYIVPYDRPLTPVEMAFFDYRMREYEKRSSDYGMTFQEAARGYGTMTTKLNTLQIEDESTSQSALPASVSLRQNYPNPFNAQTLINYEIGQQTAVEIAIFNQLGQKVTTLVHADQVEPGFYTTIWDGTNVNGEPVSAGTYYYRLRTSNETLTRTATIVK
jgi:hypothetical protein